MQKKLLTLFRTIGGLMEVKVMDIVTKKVKWIDYEQKL